jgi:DHA1 family multidrug resistance protein-like MFS transporter
MNQPNVDWKQTLFASWFAQLVATAGFSVVMPILPLYVRELGITDEQQVSLWSGLIFSSQAVTMAIFGPIWGAISDRRGRKIMVLRSMIGGAVLMVLMGMVQNVQQLTLLRAIQGAVTGVVTAANALVATATPREQAGYALGLLQMAQYVGASVGPLIGGLIADTLGFRSAFWVTAALLFVAGLMVLFFVHESFQPAPPAPAVPHQKRPPLHRQVIAYLAPVLGSAPLLAVLGIRVLVRTAGRLAGPVLPLFVESISSSDARVASITGVLSGISAAAGAVGALWLGRAVDRIGSRHILTFSCLASTVCYLPYYFVPSPSWLYPLQAITGLAMGGIMASISAALARLAPEGQEGMVYGVAGTAMAIANAIGPMLGSAVAAAMGLGAPFLLTAVTFALSAGVAAGLLRTPREAA